MGRRFAAHGFCKITRVKRISKEGKPRTLKVLIIQLAEMRPPVMMVKASPSERARKNTQAMRTIA